MLISLLLLACSSAPVASAPVAAPVAAPEPAPEAAKPEWFVALGEPFTATEVLPVDTLIASPAAWDGKEVVVEGVVKEVCQKKGCWHTIATADPAVNVMAKDKEYKIFLPKEAGGKKVQVKGTFAVAELPEDEARHYAEDAGRDPKAIVGPQKAFTLDVAGVKFVEG